MSASISNMRGVQGAIEQRRQSLARIDDFLIKNTAVSGRVMIAGSGEVVVNVQFPVWFTEHPIFTFGGELEEGQFVEAEIMPTISAIVEKWTRKKENRIGGGYIDGASVVVVTTGKSDQHIWLHWRVEGKAMSNPSFSEDT